MRRRRDPGSNYLWHGWDGTTEEEWETKRRKEDSNWKGTRSRTERGKGEREDVNVSQVGRNGMSQ